MSLLKPALVALSLVAVNYSAPSAFAADVYFTDSYLVYRFNGASVDTVGYSSVEAYYGWIDADERHRRLYYNGSCTNCCTTYMGWIGLDTIEYGTVAEDYCDVRHGAVEADPAANKLYSNFRNQDGVYSITRRNPDGTSVETVVDSVVAVSSSYPGPLAVDTVAEKLYWSVATYLDTMSSICTIRRADLDGQNVEDLVTITMPYRNAVDLDVGNNRLYWSVYHAGKIQCADLHDVAGNIQDVVTVEPYGVYGIDVDTRGGKLYWANPHSLKIQRANLDGSEVEDVLTDLWYSPFSISVVEQQPTDVGHTIIQQQILVSMTRERGEVRFQFELEQAAPVTIDLYNIAGRRVARLLEASLPGGIHVVPWGGRDSNGLRVPAGIYLYKARVGGSSATGKFLSLR